VDIVLIQLAGGDPFGGGGAQYVFNLGGGPGFRVHQFGGERPRRRPHTADGNEPPQSAGSIFKSLLTVFVMLMVALMSLFPLDSTPSGPAFSWSSASPYTQKHTTAKHKINYYLNPKDVSDYSPKMMREVGRVVETSYISRLQGECALQKHEQNKMFQDAQGWFYPDAEKIRLARSLELASCDKLKAMGVAINY
jgi:DnaJ family protein B protein 12